MVKMCFKIIRAIRKDTGADPSVGDLSAIRSEAGSCAFKKNRSLFQRRLMVNAAGVKGTPFRFGKERDCIAMGSGPQSSEMHAVDPIDLTGRAIAIIIISYPGFPTLVDEIYKEKPMANERLIDKNAQPSDADMVDVIGLPLANAWIELRRFLVETYAIAPVLNYGGKRYGWNVQHRKGGRPLCEMYPECGSFTALVVLGEKELDQALERSGTFGQTVRRALADTPRFHDGCWMYIRVSDPATCDQDVQDIEQLIVIKKKPSRKI
jgi:hypothetical protein